MRNAPNAWSNAFCTPAHSKLTWTPSPLPANRVSHSWITFVSMGEKTWCAPARLAISRRTVEGSETITQDAPWAMRVLMTKQPMGPAPGGGEELGMGEREGGGRGRTDDESGVAWDHFTRLDGVHCDGERLDHRAFLH